MLYAMHHNLTHLMSEMNFKSDALLVVDVCSQSTIVTSREQFSHVHTFQLSLWLEQWFLEVWPSVSCRHSLIWSWMLCFVNRWLTSFILNSRRRLQLWFWVRYIKNKKLLISHFRAFCRFWHARFFASRRFQLFWTSQLATVRQSWTLTLFWLWSIVIHWSAACLRQLSQLLTTILSRIHSCAGRRSRLFCRLLQFLKVIIIINIEK